MTIKASDFSIAKVQVVAFTPDRSALVPSKVLGAITGCFADRFDGDVQVLPIPREFPDEIPRLELKSADSRWSFASSFTRMAAGWSAQEPNDAPPPDVIPECSRTIIHFVRQNEAIQINRLACVINRIATIAGPSHELIAHFCKPDVCDPDLDNAPLRHSRGFQLHNLKQYASPLVRERLNSWVRCKAEGDLESPEKIVFEQDLNTPHGNVEGKFSVDQIDHFFSTIKTEADNILALYFPG
jgi:hypothetical protein